MDKFWNEIQAGEIQFRDRWQFELKSEFAPTAQALKNEHLQEFYIFVPDALLINSQTYTADDFFKDQTNLFRYKTPVFTLKELADEKNRSTPLYNLSKMTYSPLEADEELRLLGNIVRSALRSEVRRLIEPIRFHKTPLDIPWLSESIAALAEDWKSFREYFDKVKDKIIHSGQPKVRISAAYVDEFLSVTIDYYFVGLLKYARSLQNADLQNSDRLICEVLTDEKHRRTAYFPNYDHLESTSQLSSDVLYRQWLLNKFIMDVLLLRANRDALMHKHRNLIGSVAAGIAMLVFLLLYTSQAIHYVQSSEPYIFLTVVFYILKDRIKEGLRSIPSIRGFGWLANYRTEIRSRDEKSLLGTLMELFSFLERQDVDPEIIEIRNKQFHTILEAYQRPEKIIYYKKRVRINLPTNERKSMLNVISWFNIHQFFTRAAEPYTAYSTFDEEEQRPIEVQLPKTYHINIILKNTFTMADQTKSTTIQKFRLIIDKTGIKEVQQLH